MNPTWRRSAFENLLQVTKYYAVGLAVNGASYLAFVALVNLRMEPKVAASILYVFAASSSFLLQRKWVFDTSVSAHSGAFRLTIMLVLNYLFNIALLYAFVDLYRFPPEIVQFCIMVVASVFFYFGNKYFVHRAAVS